MTDRKYFDIDTRPIGNVAPSKPIPAKHVGKRRRYSHKFTKDKVLKKVIGKDGQTKWRRVPQGSVVFYGKQYTHRNKAGNVNKDNL